MNLKISNPLVSVVIITYNSAKYVTETLESAYNQTYNNIELIVSDDCSTDETLEICIKWIEKNKNRFVRTEIITSPVNTGITPNYNRGLSAAKGEWIKFIAGDDMLMPDCTTTFLEIIEVEDKICLSGAYCFNDNGMLKSINENVEDLNGNIKSQIKAMIKKGQRIMGPALFIERKQLIKIGGFDERFPFVEDYPIILKYLSNGIRITVTKSYLVKHRVYNESVSNSHPMFVESIYNAIEEYAIPLSFSNKMYMYWYHLKIFFFTKKILENKQSLMPKIFVFILRSTDIIGVLNKIGNKNSFN